MNELTTQGTSGVALPNNFSFGLEAVTARDIKVPIIYIAQQTSQIVKNKGSGVYAGDIVDTLEGKVLGSTENPLRVIPYYFQKAYKVEVLEGGAYTFFANQPHDGPRPFEETKDGKQFKNWELFNFFVILKGDPSFTRYVLTFRSTNIRSAARPMLSQMVQNKQMGVEPIDTIYTIMSDLEKNKKGHEWYAFKTKQDKTTAPTEQERTMALKYYIDLDRSIKSGAVVDTSVIDDADTTQGENTPF